MNPGQIAFAADPAAPVVDREVLGQQHHAALRGVVRAAARGALEPLDAGDVHERPALAVAPRAASASARATCLQTRNVPFRLMSSTRSQASAVEEVHRAAARDAGRVHHRVDAGRGRARSRRRAPPPPASSRTSSFASRAALDAGRLWRSAPTTLRAVGGEALHAREPDPRRGARHQRDLSLETCHDPLLLPSPSDRHPTGVPNSRPSISL